MDACVWPVCEQICASKARGGERADDWEMTRACDRCERACATEGFEPHEKGEAARDTPGGRFCAGVAAGDAGEDAGDARARARTRAPGRLTGGWTRGGCGPRRRGGGRPPRRRRRWRR